MLRRCLLFLVMRGVREATEKQLRAAKHRRTQKELHPNKEKERNQSERRSIAAVHNSHSQGRKQSHNPYYHSTVRPTPSASAFWYTRPAVTTSSTAMPND